VIVIAGHGALFRVASSGLALSGVVAASVVGFMIVAHVGFGGALRKRWRGHSNDNGGFG
jgi:hypothetical protein